MADTFAARLKNLRERAGLSQYRLAQLAGMRSQQVNHLEAGKRRDPAWSTVQKLARALAVSTEELRTG